MHEAADKYQSFQSSVNSLNGFLNNVPNNKIYVTDSEKEVITKLNSQRVCFSLTLMYSVLH